MKLSWAGIILEPQQQGLRIHPMEKDCLSIYVHESWARLDRITASASLALRRDRLAIKAMMSGTEMHSQESEES